jgi:hypothetical protein
VRGNNDSTFDVSEGGGAGSTTTLVLLLLGRWTRDSLQVQGFLPVWPKRPALGPCG